MWNCDREYENQHQEILLLPSVREPGLSEGFEAYG